MADEEAGHALASPSLCGWEGAWKGQPLSARRGPDGTCVTWTQLRLLLSNFMAAVTICSDFGAQKNKV